MPRVPVIGQRNVAPQGIPGVRRAEASPEAFGAGVGRSLQQATSIFAGIAQDERVKADTAAVLEGDNKVDGVEQELIFDPQNGALARRGKDAFDLPNQVLPEFDKRAKAIEESLGSDRAKQSFRARLLQRRQSLSQKLNDHEAHQREGFYDEQDAAKLASSRAMAGNYYNDPARIAQELDTQEATVRAHGQRKGWSPDKVTEALAAQRSGTHTDVVNRYIARGEWRRGKVYFEEVRDQVSGDEGTRLEAAFTSERRREEAEAKEHLNEVKRALADEVADIRAAASLGIVAEQAPSRAALVAAFGEREGERQHRIVQTSARLATTVNELHGLSNTELAARAAEFKPTEVEGASDVDDAYRGIGNLADEVARQRREDPVQYLWSHSEGVQRALAALDSANLNEQPAAARAYLGAIDAAKERLGMTSPDLLPKRHAEAVVQRLTRPQADSESTVAAIEAEAARWGPTWPLVYRQVQDKLPAPVRVIGSGISPEAANALAGVMRLKDDELKALVEPQGVAWKDLEEAVDGGLESLTRSFGPEGAPVLNDVRRTAQMLTASNIGNGDPLAEAARRATYALAEEKYSFRAFRGHEYRVPIDVNSELVDEGATLALERFTAVSGTVQVPAGQAEEIILSQWTEAVRASGYWRTSPDEGGLDLYTAGGPVPSMQTDGAGRRLPVRYTWEQLEQLAGVAAAEEAEKLREAQKRVAGGR